jgi:hypothetical protein
MFTKFREFLRRLFQKSIAHPVIDTRVNTVIEDKIKRTQLAQMDLSDKYNSILNNYLKTYFSKKYTSQTEMAVAFKAVDKEWKKLCREVNGTEKLINIDKNAFSRQVKLVVSKTKELNEAKTEKK